MAPSTLGENDSDASQTAFVGRPSGRFLLDHVSWRHGGNRRDDGSHVDVQ